MDQQGLRKLAIAVKFLRMVPSSLNKNSHMLLRLLVKNFKQFKELELDFERVRDYAFRFIRKNGETSWLTHPHF